MLTVRRMSHLVLALALVLAGRASGAQLGVEGIADVVASRLEQAQNKGGWAMGSWSSEELFTGSIAVGIAHAYEWTHDYALRLAAQRAGYYILRTADAQGSLLGDEAYALVRLSEMAKASGEPASVWPPAVVDFYSSMRKPGYEESTEAYLSYFEGGEPSTSVFMLAHHVVSVYYVNDVDKELWRDALVYHLSRVDDQSSFPVAALGIATWALAKIDALDDTPVASQDGAAYWDGFVLSDLPALLLSHQVPRGEPFSGSFYWRFDHSSVEQGGIGAGFTEDAVYGTLGLVAAAAAGKGPAGDDMVRAVEAALEMLMQGVDIEGRAYQHLALVGESYHAYAGEMLHALCVAKQYLDSLPDGVSG